MLYYTNMRIGTGLSVLDKYSLFHEISDLMQEFAFPADPAKPLDRGKVTHQNKSPEPALCRERLKASSGLDALTIEIYGHETDNELKKLITNELEKYLGTETDPSLFPIRIFNKELGALGDMMHDSSYEEHCARIKEVSRSIPKSDTITGAIIILENNAEQEGDPKHALRAGFADINRVTQFIKPAKEDETDTENRVNGAVMDLLRQFGFTEFTENKEEALKLSDEIGVKKAAQQLGIQYYTCQTGVQSEVQRSSIRSCAEMCFSAALFLIIAFNCIGFFVITAKPPYNAIFWI